MTHRYHPPGYITFDQRFIDYHIRKHAGKIESLPTELLATDKQILESGTPTELQRQYARLSLVHRDQMIFTNLLEYRPIRHGEKIGKLKQTLGAKHIYRADYKRFLRCPSVEKAFDMVEKGSQMTAKELIELYGCSNPTPQIMGTYVSEHGRVPFWHLEQIHRWRTAPIDAETTVARCGKCKDCNRTKRAQTASLGELEWHHKGYGTIALGRTFATGLHEYAAACRYANNRFHMSIRNAAKRAGYTNFRITSVEEYGSINGRRHYHDAITGIGLSQLFDLFEADVSETNDGHILFANKHWPVGMIHAKMITSAQGARYYYKYTGKHLDIIHDEDEAATRQQLKRRGQLPIARPVRYPRPMLGYGALDEAVKAQLPRLEDEARMSRIERLQMEDKPTGLLLPDDPFVDGRQKKKPILPRPQDRKRIKDELGIDLTRLNKVNAELQAEAIAEATYPERTIWADEL